MKKGRVSLHGRGPCFACHHAVRGKKNAAGMARGAEAWPGARQAARRVRCIRTRLSRAWLASCASSSPGRGRLATGHGERTFSCRHAARRIARRVLRRQKRVPLQGPERQQSRQPGKQCGNVRSEEHTSELQSREKLV